MNFLDLRTVIATGVLTYVICSLVMLALWRQGRKQFDGLGLWAGDFILQTLGLLIFVLRGNLIPTTPSILLANFLVVTGAVLGYIGLERFIKCTTSKTGLYVYLAAAGVVHVYLTLAHPDMTWRTANVMLALAVVCGRSTWLLTRRVAPALRPCTRWVAGAFALYTMVFALRIVWVLSHPFRSSDYFSSGPAEAVFHLVLQLLFVLLTYSLVLMVNRRLLATVRAQEQKFFAAFHEAPYAIALTRLADGTIFEVNQTFTNMTGYTPAEALGKTTVELHIWHRPEDRSAVVTDLEKTGHVHTLHTVLRKKSGELMHTLFSAAVILVGNERCVVSCISDITEQQRAREERERLISEREQALSEIRILSGLLPICAACKKIRDDKGYWNQLESYIRTHSQAEFTHGLCPECSRKMYGEILDDHARAPLHDARRD